MQFSIRFLLLLALLVATFCGGWVAKSSYDNWRQTHIPPVISGTVLRTREDLIAVSIGSDDGIGIGDVFSFRRGNQYLGRGQVVQMRSNISAVKLFKEKDDLAIRQGDCASLDY